MCRWPHFRPSLEGGGEQAVGAVEVEDARDVATNRAADASAESSEAGAVDMWPQGPSADAAATDAPAKDGAADGAVNAPGEEPQHQAMTPPTPTRRAFRRWSRKTTARH